MAFLKSGTATAATVANFSRHVVRKGQCWGYCLQSRFVELHDLVVHRLDHLTHPGEQW